MVSTSSVVHGAERHGQQAGRASKRALSGRHLEWMARAGLATKAALFVVIGVLAFNTALQGGGRTPDSKDAIAKIAAQPFGMALLGLVTAGLFAYALWRIAQGALDLDNYGSDGKGMAKRVATAVSGAIYGLLGVTAARMLAGTGGGGGSKQGWTASLMGSTAGRAFIGVVGLLIIGYGLYHFAQVVKLSYMKRLKRGEMSAKEQDVARWSGRIGLSARGVVFIMIGYFFAQAAWQRDPSEAGGLSQALATVLQQPYGPWLLGLVAIGLLAYAAFCAVLARYRTVPTSA